MSPYRQCSGLLVSSDLWVVLFEEKYNKEKFLGKLQRKRIFTARKIYPISMKFFCYVILYLCCLNTVCAQDSTLSHLQQLPGKYFAQINSKSNRFEKQVSKRSEKALNKLARQERKMRAKLAKIDSLAAKNIFTRSIYSLGNLKSRPRTDPIKLRLGYNF